MKKILVWLFIFNCTANVIHAQNLERYTDTAVEKDPEQYLINMPTKVPAAPEKAAGIFYNAGRCYEMLNLEDKAASHYIKAKALLDAAHDKSASKELSLIIYRVISSQEHYQSGIGFLNEYYDYAKETKAADKLALAYNEFGKNAITVWESDSIPNIQRLDSVKNIFNLGLKYALKSNKPAVICKLYNNLYAAALYNGNYKAARKYLDLSIKYATKSGDDFEVFTNYYNYGVSYFFEENYIQAITWFKKAESVKIPKFKQKSLRVLYKKLMESYDAVNNQDNRKEYQKRYLDLEAKINDEQQNIAIHETEIKYKVNEKEKQIVSLQNFKNKFQKNRLVFGILLFLVFLLALYSFVRWKKVDLKKKKLEKENKIVNEEKVNIEVLHQKTVEELEKVKKIVTEEYIVLKDNTKVYLKDLMYVKAEDHYLNLFSQDNKKHFVRSKISQLIDELPPNFKRCHRSYIVNINYILSYGKGAVILKNKETIPVSRNYNF